MSDTKDKKNVIKFNVNKTYLLDKFDEAFDKGDWYGAISVLNDLREKFDCDAEYFENLIDVYDEMGEYGCTLNAWYEYIRRYGFVDNATEKYEGLAVTYSNLGMENESLYYYKKMISSIRFDKLPLELSEDELDFISEHAHPNSLQMAYSKNNPEPSDALKEGIYYARLNKFDEAVQTLSQIEENSEEYIGAANLAAICLMLKGDCDKGLALCDKILKKYPDDVQTLTNVAAIYIEQGKLEESAKITRSLCEKADLSSENLYRIASVACESGMDEEGLKIFLKAEKDSPFEKNTLYCIAVAAYRTGRYAMSSKYFRKLLTIYPKSSVAAYYFAAAEEGADLQKFGAAYEPIDMPYAYHVPLTERDERIRYLLKAEKEKSYDARCYNVQKMKYLEWAFDEYGGQDTEVQFLAVKVAVQSYYNDFLDEILMRYDVSDAVKIKILYHIMVRNQQYDFKLVVANIYCQFSFYPLNLGRRQRKQFILCTADLISRYSYFDEDNVEKISAAASQLNAIYSSDGERVEADDKSLECAIYLVADISDKSWIETIRSFDADLETVLSLLKIGAPSLFETISKDSEKVLSKKNKKGAKR